MAPPPVKLIALLGAILVLLAVPSFASAASPWWQVVDGSRPSHLWEPGSDTEVQEIEVTELYFEVAFAAKIEISGGTVGCLAGGPVGPFLCEPGQPVIETAAQLQATLETAYGGTVEVTGGPVGVAPLQVATPGRWVEPLRLSPIIFEGTRVGNAETEVTSEDSGRLVVTITNLGDAPVDATDTPVTIHDQLPEGVVAWGVEAFAGFKNESGPVDCSLDGSDEISCQFEGELPPYEAIELEVFTILTGSPPLAAAPGAAPGEVTVSGGNAPTAHGTQEIAVSPAPVPFGIERFSVEAEEEGGAPAARAGSHPFQYTTTLQLNSGRMINRLEGVEQPALPRNLRFPLPPGFLGNVASVPPCPMADFFEVENASYNLCPDDTIIGVASVTIVEAKNLKMVRIAVPVFNLTPARGVPARFGLMPAGTPVVIDFSVDPDDGYRITGNVRNATELAQFLSTTLVVWGAPGDPRHDSSRGWGCVLRGESAFGTSPCLRPSGLGEDAFLTLPGSCTAPLEFGATAEPWNTAAGSVVDRAFFAGDALVGCNQIPFSPAISAAPTSRLAENPSGLDFRLEMPNSGLFDRGAITEGQPKKVEVTLPEGVTINPSQAKGLAVCSPDQYAQERFDAAPAEGCPDAAKIGEIQVSTPLLKEEAHGALYVAKPYDNPTGSLIGLYLIAKIPERGILIKQAGKVTPDPKTGQLVTTFDDLPQLPFSTFKLHFREGGRAPLVTPPSCDGDPSEPGDQPFTVSSRFTPWSASDPNNPAPNEIVETTSSFTIERGVDGGTCPSGGVPAFKPGFEAGSINNAAGHYSPFYMRLTRKDGDQDLTKFSSILPEGALAKLAGLTQCPQAAVEGAKGKDGLDEKATPSCPASSQIGRTSVGAGVGSILTYVPGQLYLGGPYHGSPLSVVSITPAVAGPFDLGTVVVQEALDLDPATSEVHVDGNSSDPIPHILQGIPLKVRDLRVYVDRDNFTTTPTSCDPMATKATLFGSGLDVFSASDDVAANLSAHYQAASCESLGFKPRLKLRLSAKRSTRGAYPALRAVLRPRIGDANPDRIQVTLPGSELLEQGHIRTICTRVQFAANGGNGGGCPAGSIYGHVKAWTPLLDQPLEGPVYLRSSNHELPDLVLALHGLVDIESVGRIDSSNARLRTTFENVPDAPLSKVVLSMQGGRKGLLVNSTDICRGVHRAKARFTGQNGKVLEANPQVQAGCKKGKKRSKR